MSIDLSQTQIKLESSFISKNKNNLQFQLTGGKSVSAYNTSVQGNGYDGYVNTDGLFEGLPSFGD